jgi:hypothetical protein
VVRRPFGPEGQEFSRFRVAIGAERQFEFYLWKVILPLIAIVVISWSVFWVHPSDLNTQMQVSITSMLAAIAFNFAVSSSLPELAYLTWLDAFIFTCYSMIFLSIVEDMVVHVAWRSGRQTLALRLDRACRWAFPLAFLLANAALGLAFLRSRLSAVALF